MPASLVPGTRSARHAAAATVPAANPDTVESARQAVRGLLERSDAFAVLPEDKRRELARGLVQIGTYLAEPDGMRLKQQSPQVRALAGEVAGAEVDPAKAPKFGQAVRAGVEEMANLVEQVNFPSFVSGLIQGVFHSIVDSSIQQMEAYAKLVADVSKSLNQFRDDNTTQNQGRDHLMEQFPDLFQLGGGDDAFGSFGDSGGSTEPRVVLRDDVDEAQAMQRLNRSLPLEKPLSSLDDELVEALLVPAARTQLATGRQQLLATMVMMGINRIVVTDGKISAKVMFDFKANDSRRYALSRTDVDHQKDAYGNVQKNRSHESSYEGSSDGSTYNRSKDGTVERTYGSYYAKGDYKYSEQPIVKLVSTQKLMDDSQLSTKASLTGAVEVNFKSDYLPLDKMATPENIAAIQMNAQPGMVKTLAGRPAPASAPPAATPPAATPAA
jgi:hypothetical protein